MTIEERFKSAIEAAGLTGDFSIATDGRLRRFHVDGDRVGTKNGWYLLHPDHPPIGMYGCHKRGISETWTAEGAQPLSPEERLLYAGRLAKARDERDQELAQTREACRVWCAAWWKRARTAPDNHPYLVRKGVPSYGLRLLGESLLVPLRDVKGFVHGMQFIAADGSKKFKFGTAKNGNFFHIGAASAEVILVAEGYATGATLHKATGRMVIVAFDAGNLRAVGMALRSKYPTASIIFCADDDYLVAGNPGITKAREAALAVKGSITTPIFPTNRGPKDTDFNDMAKYTTSAEIRNRVLGATSPVVFSMEDTKSWEEPFLFGEQNIPDIPCSLLPGWLGKFASAVAKTTQTPEGVSTMMALSTVAACVQKRFQVVRAVEHIEPLAIWTVTAQPPASRKTAVVNAFTAPLIVWEKGINDSERPERDRIEALREVLDTKIKALHARAGKTDDGEKRRELVEQACKLRAEMPDPLLPRRIFTGDVTPERLQALMMEQAERMALLSDEGGIFSVMAGLYSGGRINIDVFLKGHAGSAIRVDRQERMAHLDAPCLTFGLCVQPDVIRRLSQTPFRGNGCLARFLYCLPASNIGTRSARADAIPDDVKAAYFKGIFQLLNIPPQLDELGKETPRTLTLSAEAEHVWEEFFSYLEENMGKGKELSPLQDWAGKLAGAAMRIAGLMTIVRDGLSATEIGTEVMTQTVTLCKLLISHAKAAFDLMDGDDTHHDAKGIYEWVVARQLRSFTLTEVYQGLRRFNDANRLKRALALLEERHIISKPTPRNTGGRSSTSFAVNPHLFQRL